MSETSTLTPGHFHQKKGVTRPILNPRDRSRLKIIKFYVVVARLCSRWPHFSFLLPTQATTPFREHPQRRVCGAPLLSASVAGKC